LLSFEGAVHEAFGCSAAGYGVTKSGAGRGPGVTATVLSFLPAVNNDDREALLAVAAELHALITLDRVEGTSPVRIYFVMSPPGKRKVSARLGAADAARTPEMYALVAYDFPFALFQFEMRGAQITPERAKEIISCSAELQEDSLVRAATAMGLHAAPVPTFDADGLKVVFFPNTQETVIHVLRLSRV
jgi:hypothetical protein